MYKFCGYITFCVIAITIGFYWAKIQDSLDVSRLPYLKETFWTDENILFWSITTVPEPFDPNDKTASRVYYEMLLFKQEAEYHAIKCAPIFTTMSLETILRDLIREEKLLTEFLELLKPFQFVRTKRCPSDVCENKEMKCLPTKDVRRGVTAVRMIFKNKTSIDRRIEKNVINKILNGTFIRKEAAAYFTIEKHIFCTCQCR